MPESIAIVGAGKFGRVLLKSFLQKAKIECVSSNGNLKNKEEVKKILPQVLFRNNLEIAKDSKIKSVVIATPIESLYKTCKLFISSGKNVFLEKPGAMKHEEIKELISMLADDQILYIDYLTILDPTYQKFKTILKKESIKQASFFWEKSGSLKSDILLNLLCHDLSVAFDLFGDTFIKIKKSVYNERTCKLLIEINSIDLEIYINRSKEVCLNKFYIKTDSGLYHWDKELSSIFLNEKLILENSRCDLVDLSRDKFLNMINLKKRSCSNLDLSSKILKTIEEIKK